jgi:hypothetical protein
MVQQAAVVTVENCSVFKNWQTYYNLLNYISQTFSFLLERKIKTCLFDKNHRKLSQQTIG